MQVSQYTTDMRGFDPSSSAYHQAQQNHEALRRRDQAPGAPQAVGPSQQPTGQQQQLPANPDDQHQQLQPNPRGSPPTQAAASMMPATPAQQAARAANNTLWVSYRAPSPRNLASPPAFSQPRASNGGGGGGGGDHAQYPPSSYYAQGPEGAETVHYPPAPPNPVAGGGVSGGGGGGDGYGAWSGSSAGGRPESFPPVAAFASNGSGSNGGGTSSGAGAGINGAASGGGGGAGGAVGAAQRPPDATHTAPPEVRGPHQPYLQRQQQQQYWDRSLSGRGWPTVGGDVAPLHPPSRVASSDFARAPPSSGLPPGDNSVAAGPSQSPPLGVRAVTATTASAGWR